jgi:hypothetical protein
MATKRKPLVLATFETPNFRFAVVAKTESEAIEALRKDWAGHARVTGADPDYFSADGVRTERFEVGEVFEF